MSRTFVLNLVALLIFFIAVPSWVFAFTGWFSSLAPIWFIGGLVCWLAFAWKLLPKARVDRLRTLCGERVFEHPRTWQVVAGIFAVLLLLSSFIGAVEIESASDLGDRQVTLAGETEHLPAGGRLRELCWVPWTGGTRVIKVTGLPSKSITVYPWWIEGGAVPCQAPWSFTKPVVLIVPHIRVAKSIPEGSTLEVIIRGMEAEPVTLTLPDYDGRLVWIGLDREKEQDLLRPPPGSEFLTYWRQAPELYSPPPAVLSRDEDPSISLERGYAIEAKVFDPDEMQIAYSRTLIVREPSGEDFIQTLLLEPLP